MAGTLQAFLTMTARALPELRRAFAAAWVGLGTPDEHSIIDRVYENLPCRDFSRDVLAPVAQSLVIAPVQDVYWNNLGDPRRVYETLAKNQVRPSWKTQRNAPTRNQFFRQVLPRMARVDERALRYDRRIQ